MKSLFITFFTLALIQAANAETVQSGAAAPCVALEQVNSTGVRSQETTCKASVTGKKLVLDFFATWCQYCVAGLPDFERLAATHSNKAEFRIVGIDEKPDDLLAYFQGRDMTHYNLAFDNALKAVQAFGIDGVPTTVVIGLDGKVELIHIGETNSQSLKDIEKAIQN